MPTGAQGSLPLEDRAKQSETEWADASREDYEKAIADCLAMGGAVRQECMDRVELGFRAAQSEAMNPAEQLQHQEDFEQEQRKDAEQQ